MVDKKLRDLAVSFERCFLKMTDTYSRQPSETKDERFQKLGKKYGIKIITEDHYEHGAITYDAPKKSHLNNCAKTLSKDLAVYPKEIIEASRIEQIILTRNLTSRQTYGAKGQELAGLAMVGFHVVDTLFLEAQLLGRRDWVGNRLFHHELYHAIDYRDTWFGYVDSDWRDLQGPNFQYGREMLEEHLQVMGPVTSRDAKIEDFDISGINPRPSDEPGFVSDYARYSHIEDKAEIYASLITDYSSIMERAKEDKAIDRKVEHMKMLLAKFNTSFDKKFWNKRATNS